MISVTSVAILWFTKSFSDKMRIKLIANPAAGSGRIKTIEQVREYLECKGASVDLYLTGKRGDAVLAAKVAAEEGFDTVVVMGGDGTLNEVVNGLAGSSVNLGFIPLGTVNVFALETGIPMDPIKACDVIYNGSPTKISLGRVNDRYFVLMAGIGFDAYVVYGVNLKLKRFSGRISYVIKALTSLFSFPGYQLEIELDNGERIAAYGIVVGNGKYYGGSMSVTPSAELTRGDLDVCLFKGKGPANMLRYVWGIMRRKHLGYSDVEYRTVKGLRVSSKGESYIQADGDAVGKLPAEFSVLRDGVSVILPSVTA